MAIPKQFKKKTAKEMLTPKVTELQKRPVLEQPAEAPKQQQQFIQSNVPARADKETGGIYQKDNSNFILPKKDVQQLADKNQYDPLQAQKEQLQQQTQQTGVLTPEQMQIAEIRAGQLVQEGFLGLPSNINYQQALIAGGAEGSVGFTAGAGVGAIGGAAVGGVGAIPGAIGGAALGGLGAFIRGAYADIKQQQQGLVKADALNVDRAITNLNNIVSAVNSGADPIEAQFMYNQVVMDTYQSWYELKSQTKGTGKAFEDGTKQLEKFEIFFRQNGILDSVNLKMNQAIINPNPSKISATTYEEYIGQT